MVVCLALGSGSSIAATLEVGPGAPFATIQSAIDAATPVTDDVHVRCGVYFENIVLKSGVSVTGSGPGCTVIDGGGAGSVVSAVDIGGTTLLEGFTIRNGSASQGGGVFIESSALRIHNNVIESNQAVGAAFPDGVGGGIHIQTTFRAFTEPVIVGNVIRDNTAERFGGGISIDTDDGSKILNNVITGNTAGLSGGGIDMFSSFPDVVNNTIVRNCSQSGGPVCTSGGGGIAITDSGVVDLINNLVAWNESASGGAGIDVAGSSTVNLQHNDSFMNLPSNYDGVADPTGSMGNISVDPLLANEKPTLDGHLPRSDSPLVDAGVASLVTALDLRGVPRSMDGDADGNPVPEIGARENEGPTRLLADGSRDFHWDVSVDPAALFNAYRGELTVLWASGEYTQDPIAAPGSNQWCDLVAATLSDGDLPAGGETWFYLFVIRAAAEGTLGFDGSLTERPFTDPNRCP